MSWPVVKLSDIFEISSSKRVHQHEWRDEGVPFYRAREIVSLARDGYVNNDLYIDESLYEEYSRKYGTPKEGDLLISAVGTLGKTYAVKADDRFYFKDASVIWLKKKADVDTAFIQYAMKTDSVQSYIQNYSGATVGTYTISKAKKTEIPLPPLPIQKKIAATLEKADTLRSQCRQMEQELNQLAQSVFLEMFGDPVTNPKGWKKKALSKLMTIKRGGSPRPIDKFLGGTYPWVKIGDATKGDDLYISKTKVAIIESGLSKTVYLPAGSLIFANCGVSLGFARILNIPGCIHDGWLSFSEINDEVINKIFLLKSINSITQYFRDIAPDGTQPNLNTKIMKEFEIILPPIDMQYKFEKFVYSISNNKQEIIALKENYENLFNSLMQRAFKGELELTEAA